MALRIITSRWSRIAVLLLVAGCSAPAWQKVELKPQSLGGNEVRVYTRRKNGEWEDWRSVAITADSVSGRPCHRCTLTHENRRLVLSLTDVDSIMLDRRVFTVGDRVGGGALGLAIIALMTYLVSRPEFH